MSLGNNQYTLSVDEMSCQHCVAAVEKAVLAVSDVESATVDLEGASVTVTGGLPHKVIEAITEAGYPAKPQPKIPDSCSVEPELPSAMPQESPNAPNSRKITEEGETYTILINDMTCSSCVGAVERAALSTAGVSQAQINLVEKKAWITGGIPTQVVNSIVDQGYDAHLVTEVLSEDLLVLHFQCERSESLDTRLKTLTSEQQFDWPQVSLKTHLHPADLLLELEKSGYKALIDEQFEDPHKAQVEEAARDMRQSWKRALLAGGVGTFLMTGEMGHFFPSLTAENGQLFWTFIALICLFTMWFSGRNYYSTALKKAKHLSSNMDTLVALGTSAAWFSSVILIFNPNFIPGGEQHLYLDASVLILAFLQFGHALETRAKRITSEAIGALVELAPKTAQIIRQDQEVMIPVSLLRLNDRVRIKPGEVVPIDGEVISGSSTIDESMLTGESVAVVKQVGDEVIGGTINHRGSLLVRVHRLGDETTLANIISMVEKAQLSKPPIASLVDKVSAVFVPTVVLISITSFIAWWLLGPEPQLAFALTAGIAVLVIACPCALGLATPIAIMVGTGRAAQLGVLIKNSDALQSASHLTHLVMDKTGTLTEGCPSITELYSISAYTEEKLLQIALSLETGSEHPLAEAIIRTAKKKEITAQTCLNFQAISGRGISGDINEKCYFLGNEKWLAEQGINIPSKWQEISSRQAAQGGTPIWLADSLELLGLLILKDPIREDSATAIKALHEQGIQLVMCTGDHKETAAAVGNALGIDQVYSELLPEQKLEIITELQAKGYRVGMVGDGVNDAPALAKANTGFAIGSGTDVAIENADITLVGDSLKSVSTAISISSATIRNIKENLFGAFIYNVIGIPLAAGLFFPLTGWLLSPMFASFAMAMSSVTVVTNANRLRFFKPN
ncbi:MAG: heavy metal translocating P-type ATPase [Gammaproteobacteria bacterium]|nr:heavy metal translocating P-type ATPase [Gammaproteobacteria bacterium]